MSTKMLTRQSDILTALRAGGELWCLYNMLTGTERWMVHTQNFILQCLTRPCEALRRSNTIRKVEDYGDNYERRSTWHLNDVAPRRWA